MDEMKHEDDMRAALAGWVLDTRSADALTMSDFREMVAIAITVMNDAVGEQRVPNGTLDWEITTHSAAAYLLHNAPMVGIGAAMLHARAEPHMIHKGNAHEFFEAALKHLAGEET
jgi:hypothetical protein